MRSKVAAIVVTSALGCGAGLAPHFVTPGSIPDAAPAVSESATTASSLAAPSSPTRVDIQLEDVSPAQASSDLGNRVRDTVRDVAEACGREAAISPATRVRVMLGRDGQGPWKASHPEAEALSAIDDAALRCLLDGVRAARLHGRKGEVGPPSVIVTWLPAAAQ